MITKKSNFYWISSVQTDVGMIRKVNEDACLDRTQDGIWAVADGMGGHCAGDVASRMIIQALGVADASVSLSNTVTDIEQRLIRVNRELRELASSKHICVIGSTVAALLLSGQYGVCIWVGDSRVYRVRNGQILQISQDHAFVEDLIEKGILNRDDAASHPQSNLVTRAVGAQDHLKLDMEIFKLARDDIFVLCSDGLDKEVSEEEIAATALRHSPDSISQELVDLALSRGARDNVTVASVALVDPNQHSNNENLAMPRHRLVENQLKALQRKSENDANPKTDFGRLARHNQVLPAVDDDDAVTIRSRNSPLDNTSKDEV